MTSTDLHLFSPAEQPAVDAYIHAAIVPFIVEKAGARAVLGTGTLFGLDDRCLIVTAEHVLKDVDPASLAIGVGEAKSVAMDSSFKVHRARDGADVAIVELEANGGVVSTLNQNRFQFLDRSSIGAFDEVHQDYLVVGFPSSLAELGADALTPGAAHIITKPWSQEIPRDFDHSREFLLSHGTADGSSRRFLKLNGISGATVWAVRDRGRIDGIWSPQAVLNSSVDCVGFGEVLTVHSCSITATRARRSGFTSTPRPHTFTIFSAKPATVQGSSPSTLQRSRLTRWCTSFSSAEFKRTRLTCPGIQSSTSIVPAARPWSFFGDQLRLHR